MKICPDPTEKYSRRTFTKSIAAALAATSLTPSVVRTEKMNTVREARARFHPHLVPLPANLSLNHMPPLIFSSGSLEIESAAELFTKSLVGGVYTYEQRRVDGCFVYGNIARVNIISDRGRRIYSEEATGRWEIRLLLQKLIRDVAGELEFEPDPPAGQAVVIRSAAEGFFELTVMKDLGRATPVRKRKLNRYHTLKKYGFSQLGQNKFRIGQVTVMNEILGTRRFPESLTEPGTFAREGFEIFIEFEDEPNPSCRGRDLTRNSKSFWKRFLFFGF